LPVTCTLTLLLATDCTEEEATIIALDELREELLGDVTAEELGVLLATEIALDETALLLTAPLQLLTNAHEPSLPGMLCVHQLAR
jgi:hypothetical protein